MESDKPRVISIHAETSTDFEKPRVSIPTTRAVVGLANVLLNTDTLSRSFSSGSIPIRAPLTIDEDDSSSVNDERYSATSDVSNYSRRLGSETDDELEYASGDADDETALEIGGVRVHTPLEEDPDGEIEPDNEFSGGSVIYRPFAGDIDEETSVNQFSFSEEESESSDNIDSVSESEVSEADRDNMKAKVVIPRAMLSLDDDEFDEILGSDDEQTALVRVVDALGNIEVKLGENELLVEDMVMIDKPECSGTVTDEFVFMEEEAVREHTLVEEHTLVVTPGAFSDCMVKNEGSAIMEDMEFDETFKPFIEKEVVERGIAMDDGGGDTREVDSLMKPSDEEVEDKTPEVEELGMTDKPQWSVFVEEKVLVKFSGESFGTIDENNLGVSLGDCNEFPVESEGNSVDASRGSDNELLVEDMGMIDKPECSDSVMDEFVSTEEEHTLVEEQTHVVTPGALSDCMVENEGNTVMANMEFDKTFKPVFEKEVVERGIAMDDGGGDIHEVDSLMKPSDEGVEDTAPEVEELGMTDKSECSIFVTPELISSEEEKVLVKFPDESFGTIDEDNLGVSLGDSNEFPVGSKGNSVDANRGSDENSCSLYEQRADQESSLKETNDGGTCESDVTLNPVGGSIRLESRDMNDEHTRDIINNAFQLIPTLNPLKAKNLEVSRGIDIIESGCGFTDQEAEQVSYASADKRMENETQMADLIHDHTVLDLDGYEGTSESTFPEGRLNLLMLCCAVYSKADSSEKHNTLIEKSDLFRSKLDSDPEILWEEQRSQKYLEQDMNPVKNQPEDEVRHEKGTINKGVEELSDFGCIRIKRGRFGIQVKKFTIYLDVSGLNTGFAINSRDYKKSFYSEKHDKEEGKVSVRMRGSSMAVLGLIPVLMSVLSSVYGGK